jgi:hypothetical protein
MMIKTKNQEYMRDDEEENCADCEHHKRFHAIQQNKSGQEYYGRCIVLACNCSIFNKP